MMNHKVLWIVVVLQLIAYTPATAQTTFTESAASYGLRIDAAMIGGHAWADFDLDGDFDIVLNSSGQGYLMRNNGNGTFTDIKNPVVPQFFNCCNPFTAMFVDFSADGHPDIVRNDVQRLGIYLYDPINNRYGTSNGSSESQVFTTLANFEMRLEGGAVLDYDGDGDLDFFFENDEYGIDIFQNDGTGFFNHVTRKADSPNPPYNSGDSTTWPLGLPQDTPVGGDYGAASDVNDDGWVDIVVRKPGSPDIYLNNAGTFTASANLDNPDPIDKGSVALGDLDNDGDLDLFWTGVDRNQIHRNNGDGTWTAMGAGTGIPMDFTTASSDRGMSGVAIGDVDNDGDLDIFLSGNNDNTSRNSKLFINNGGLSFTDSGLTFPRKGNGVTFVDIDNDGDLDIYQNSEDNSTSERNALYINDLGATPRGNHLFVDVKENRDAFGLTGTEERYAIGAIAKIFDCSGNFIAMKELNGGQGMGTQEPGRLHFGLPANAPVTLEVSFPRTADGNRLVIRKSVVPSDFFNGDINLIEIRSEDVDLPPVAQDDPISTTVNTSIDFDVLVDNGNGADSDPEGDPFELISITQPLVGEGTATLNPDGTITFNSSGYVGVTSFTYTIRTISPCTLGAPEDTGTVYVTVFPDTDSDGVADIDDLDDDNDGILDQDENNCGIGGVYALSYDHNNPIGSAHDLMPTIDGSSFVASASNESIGAGLILLPRNVPDSQTFLQLEGAASATLADAIVDEDYIEFSFITNAIAAQGAINAFSINPELDRTPVQENNHKIAILLSNNNFTTYTTLVSDYIVSDVPGFRLIDVFQQQYLNPSSTYQIRVYFYSIPPAAAGTVSHDDIGLQISSCFNIGDEDGDGIPNKLDLDSDNDGIYDLVEAGHNQSGTAGRISGTIGANGLADSVETAAESGVINYTVANTDLADNNNFLDGDSDNDGCSDANEAYNNPNADGGDNPFFGTGNPPATDSNGLVSAAGYPNPADADANTTADYLEVGATPTITNQPANTQAFNGSTTTFTVVASANTDRYQWQIFNGTSWVNLTNTGPYSGTTTATLTIAPVSASISGSRYRVNLSQSSYVCSEITSTEALLTSRSATIITNRRITYRVKG
ncbi:MAG: FG-GAP-like repeat-containing protein [Bacteroidota bacterium]